MQQASVWQIRCERCPVRRSLHTLWRRAFTQKARHLNPRAELAAARAAVDLVRPIRVASNAHLPPSREPKAGDLLVL
eukprot:scaffold86399_cov74-Phaeocystis_antarctica.AAC.4